jgi:hypothetical protein
MTYFQELDDSRLLDIVIEQREEEVRAHLDAETRNRLDEIKRIHGYLAEAASSEPEVGLSPVQMENVVRRVREAGKRPVPILRGRRMRWPHVAAAAAVTVLALLGWSVFGPAPATDAVQASVFGGIELRRGGTVLKPQDHNLRIEAGDVIEAPDGAKLNMGLGYLIEVGRDTKLACLQISERNLVLELRSGQFRCEAIPARVTLTLLTHGSTIRARDAVFGMQFMCRNDDQLIVDRGRVEATCPGKTTLTVTPATGPFSLTEFCPCSRSKGGRAQLEPCCKHGKRLAQMRSFPIQATPKHALRMARDEGVPILVTRDDGPDISSCYRSCCFVGFNHNCRTLRGVVWLVVDPKRHADWLTTINLDRDANGVVVLNHRSEVIDRGHVESRDDAAGTILNLVRSGRKACGGK